MAARRVRDTQPRTNSGEKMKTKTKTICIKSKNGQQFLLAFSALESVCFETVVGNHINSLSIGYIKIRTASGADHIFSGTKDDFLSIAERIENANA
jgi:hypothetical protein